MRTMLAKYFLSAFAAARYGALMSFFIIATWAVPSHAQKVYISAGVEKTATRCLYGGALTLELKSKWGVGAFFQNSFLQRPNEFKRGKDTFFGILGQIPLAKTEKIDFFATARLGFVDETYLVAVPGLETRIKTFRKLSTVFGMGYRSGYPAVALKLAHPLF